MRVSGCNTGERAKRVFPHPPALAKTHSRRSEIVVTSKNTGRPAAVQIPPAVQVVTVPPGGAVLILTASRPEASTRSTEPEAPWTRTEILALARRMVQQLRDGFARAARYLKSVGIELQEALQALFPRRT
jgi:hypothetical protein